MIGMFDAVLDQRLTLPRAVMGRDALDVPGEGFWPES